MNTKKTQSMAKSVGMTDEADKATDIPEIQVKAQPRPRPCPRPRSRPQVSKDLPSSQDNLPETPLAPTTCQVAASDALQSTPLNVGGGIPSDDESDAEEYAAVKSSPIKGGAHITSNVSSTLSSNFLILTFFNPIGHRCHSPYGSNWHIQAFPKGCPHQTGS